MPGESSADGLSMRHRCRDKFAQTHGIVPFFTYELFSYFYVHSSTRIYGAVQALLAGEVARSCLGTKRKLQ